FVATPSVVSSLDCFVCTIPAPFASFLFPYTTLFRSVLRRDPNFFEPAGLGEFRRRPNTGPSAARAPGRSVHRDARRGTHCGHRRSEEHTSELQSPDHLVCPLLLAKKKT